MRISPLAFAAVLVPFGVGFMAASAVTFGKATSFASRATTTTGKVVELAQTGSFYPVIEFKTASGQPVRFNGTIGSNPPAYALDQEVAVLYNPNAPEQAKIDAFSEQWLFPLNLFCAGSVLALGGAFSVASYLRRRAIISNLKKTGIYVQASVVSVQKRSAAPGISLAPWIITLQWRDPATNVGYLFQSEPVWNDPSAVIELGQSIEVLVDPKNPQNYVVELPNVPSKAA